MLTRGSEESWQANKNPTRVKMETSALKTIHWPTELCLTVLLKTRIKELKYLYIIFFQGYQGLVDGGDDIREAKWEEMSGIIQLVCIFVCHKYEM